jgi:hypothetical protein
VELDLTRTRASYSTVTGDVLYDNFGTFQHVGTETADTHYWECTDDAHQKPYPDGPLSIVKYTPIGGLTTWNTPNFCLRNCPVAFGGNDPPKLDGTSLTSFKNRALSGSGPLSADIHLPVSLFELREIPKMLRHAGNLLHNLKHLPSGLSPAKEAASAHLAYQFGWKPIIQDLNTLTGFGEMVAKKQRNLTNAMSAGGLKRRVSLGSDSGSSSGTTVVHSTWGIFIAPAYRDTMSYKRWATIRWNVIDASQIGKQATWTDAMRTSLGLNKGHIPIEIWKAMPWSWLIDWSAGISDVLIANYNSIFFRPSLLCIMQHSKSERQFFPTGQFAGLTKRVEWKERTIDSAPNASVTLRIPFLDSFKLSILGSLAIQKLL